MEKILRIAGDCITSVKPSDVQKMLLNKAENITLSFVKPAYYIINGGEVAVDVIQIANLIKRNVEVMNMTDATSEIGFCIWYPGK